ncbi:E3 ubiquitin-protein ligase bre1 [Entomortierella chlamydospora]|nr:E3 ubiquitin-protein ligase bre1 [Entomortierella chlamydospora]
MNFKISPSRDSSVAAFMDDRGNRKRRLNEDSGQHGQVVASAAAAANGSPAPFIPPANKRQFTGSGSSSPLNNTKEDTENMTAAEGVLLNFQKEAIWRQMQEYKREIARAQERIDQLEDKQADYDSQINSVDAYWNKLLEELRTLVSRSRISVQKDDMFLKDGSSFASLLCQGSDLQQENQDIRELTENATKPTVEASCERTKEIVLKLLRIIEAWTTQRGSFWTGYRESDTAIQESSVIQQLVAEYNNITRQFKKGQTDIDSLQAKCHEYSGQVLRLKNELEITKHRIEETSENLDDSSEKIRQIERRIDREKNALGSTISSSQSITNIANITAATLNDMSEASRDELLQFRRLAISRLAEIEETNLQKTQMKDDLDKLRAQLDQLSDEKIQDSQYVRTLLVQMQSARHEGEFYRGEVLRLRADLEDLHASRRRFVDTLETEEKNRRATLEAELKKLESDISRVKDIRDRFQQMYENRCSKDDYEIQQNQEIRKIANTRKDRITTLSTEISRLQTMLATTSDDWDSYAFYLKNPDDVATLKDLKSKLSESGELINKLHMELESTREASLQARDLEAVRSSESQLKEQVDALSTRLAHLDSIVGPEADDEIKALMTAIEARDAAIKRLELKVQAHEAVQTPLLNELHTVANAWGQLEEATSRKAIDLAQKEDLIFKLLSDKTRQESKCNNLIRAKDQSANMMAVMKRQSDMQLDQISRLEERERSLNQQMTTLEKEQTVLSSEVTAQKTKLQEYTQINSGYKEKFSRQEERLLELQSLLKERTDAFENETAVRKRLVGESESMKRKIEEHAKKSEGGSGDSEASKQAARYLKLLKCPACDVNFKSHVILRCMHVFCKNCMDKQMEFRQRKCPTCRENFGAKDVKEIYL